MKDHNYWICITIIIWLWLLYQDTSTIAYSHIVTVYVVTHIPAFVIEGTSLAESVIITTKNDNG